MNARIYCQLLVIHLKILICFSDQEVVFAFAGDYRSVYKPTKFAGGIGRVKSQLNESMVFIFVGNNVGGIRRDRKGVELGKEVMDYLQPDAVILGKEELEVAVKELEWYISNTSNMVVSANLECIKKSMPQKRDINRNGVRIVIIGYTDDPSGTTPTDLFHYKRVVQSLNEKVYEIHLSSTKMGLIVAAGCAGIEGAMKIAQQTSNIDIIFSSCSRSLMWHDDEPPRTMFKYGPYPLKMTNRDGKSVLIVHSFGSTQFLGLLNVMVDRRGDITDHSGQMLYLSASMPNDPDGDILASKGLDPLDLQAGIIGRSVVFLDGACHKAECNLGNLIADAYIEYISDIYEGVYWTDVPIALVSATSIRSSINASIHRGNILTDDLSNVIEQRNPLIVMEVSGKDLLTSMEYGVDFSQKEFDKQFLQVSGIQIVYDTRKKHSSKIVDIKVRCAACEIPVYENLKLDQMYNVTASVDLLEIYYNLVSSKDSKITNINGTNWEAIKKYLTRKKIICPGNTDRITQLPLMSSFEHTNLDKAVTIIGTICLILYYKTL